MFFYRSILNSQPKPKAQTVQPLGHLAEVTVVLIVFRWPGQGNTLSSFLSKGDPVIATCWDFSNWLKSCMWYSLSRTLGWYVPVFESARIAWLVVGRTQQSWAFLLLALCPNSNYSSVSRCRDRPCARSSESWLGGKSLVSSGSPRVAVSCSKRDHVFRQLALMSSKRAVSVSAHKCSGCRLVGKACPPSRLVIACKFNSYNVAAVPCVWSERKAHAPLLRVSLGKLWSCIRAISPNVHEWLTPKLLTFPMFT